MLGVEAALCSKIKLHQLLVVTQFVEVFVKHFLPYRKKIWPVLLLYCALALVGCEEDPTEEPPTISAAQLVTTTLQPPLVTQTPLFTATLTPSVSPTASATPTASSTPTPTTPPPTERPTPTPTLGGSVSEDGADTKRVREGPGTTDFDTPLSLVSGEPIGVLGYVDNDIGERWYQIAYLDEESGDYEIGWMRSDLVDIEDAEAVPEITFGLTTDPDADGTPVAEDNEDSTLTTTPGTLPPFETAVPEETYTPLPTDDTELDLTALSDLNIRAEPGNNRLCEVSQAPPVTDDDTISIFWSWFVTDPELMQDHIRTVDYQITLNGAVLEDWDRFRRPMFQDPEEDRNWTVYWYVPIGELEPGEYTLAYQATWSEAIFDGIADFGPGTDNETETGQCTFTVVAAP
jgi:hypothetical protein